MVNPKQSQIVFLLPVFPLQPRTGGEIYNRQIIDRLIAAGHPVRVIALDSLVSVEKLHQSAAAGEVRKALSQALNTLHSEMRKTGQRATVVYDSWLYRFLWPFVIFERLRGRFILVSFSQLCYWDTYRSSHTRVWHRLLTLLALAPAQRRIAVSRSLLDADLGVARSDKRDKVIYPGCDYISQPLALAACSNMPAQIVSVGNYTPRKGFHVLIEAMACLFADKPPWRDCIKLRLVGNRSFNPDYLKKLEEMIVAHNLQSAVFLEDWKTRQEISSMFSESQLFAFASDSEGFGMVVLEAMLHGLPVVLGDFMTARELAGDDGRCGFVVPRSLPKAFASVFTRYFSQDDRDQMGLNARKRALQVGHGWDAAAEEFARFLKL